MSPTTGRQFLAGLDVAASCAGPGRVSSAYVAHNGTRCAVFAAFTMSNVIEECDVRVLDLDLEETDCMVVDDEKHYVPRCLKDYAVRVRIPATSKRPGMTFSNNVKLFVGAVPRRMYQTGESTASRPRVHVDLQRSVANIYRAVMVYAPFGFFVNGGRAMFEDQGEIELPEILVGDDALELDQLVLERFGLEPPEYITRLKPGRTLLRFVIERCYERESGALL